MVEEQKQPLDANSRLKARVRATVPPRETSLFRKQADENLAANDNLTTDDDLSFDQREEKLEVIQPENPKPTVGTEAPQNLVSFTLRVEDTVDKGLKYLCTNESITKETFLEAAFLACSQNEQMMQQVLEIAKARRQLRRSAGILRRAESMTKYLPGNLT
jgi:hypothetical protein